jgi:hypothetical protein
MSRPPRRTPCGLPFAAALVAAGTLEIAAADDLGEPIRLEYRAETGCPDEGAFVARVRARTARARLVGPGEHARTFVVELGTGMRPSGSVTVMNGERSDGTRRLDADTCDEVADALALMVALALDPRALSAPSLAPTSVVAPSIDAGTAPFFVPPPLDATLDVSAPTLPPPPPLSPPSLPPQIPDEPRRTADAKLLLAPSPLGLHFFGGAELAITTGVTASPIWAGSPFLGWRATRASFLGLGPSVRVAFLRADTGTVGVTGGSADFTWTVGRLDACALLWPDRALRLGPCARIEVGVLDVAGKQVDASPGYLATERSAWVAGGPLVRLEWSFLGALLFSVGAGPDFHITAHEFTFLPATNAYQVPLVGLDAEAGLGAHFL